MASSYCITMRAPLYRKSFHPSFLFPITSLGIVLQSLCTVLILPIHTMGGPEADACWHQVSKADRAGKPHPEVTCIHCLMTWHSNSRDRVIKHLAVCKELPKALCKRQGA